MSEKGTTRIGFMNRNGQIVIRNTWLPGNDYNQRVYQFACSHCGHNYGANGSDIHDRKCPYDGGNPGLDYAGADSGEITEQWHRMHHVMAKNAQVLGKLAQ